MDTATRTQIELAITWAPDNETRRQVRGMLDHFDRITHLFHSDPNRNIALEFDDLPADTRQWLNHFVQECRKHGYA